MSAGPLWLAALCLAGAALAGCSGSSSDTAVDTAGLARMVLDSGPGGYRLTLDRELSVDEVASATSANPGALARTLARTGFHGGYTRVWTSGDAYLSDLGLETDTAFGAQELLQFQEQQLQAGRGVIPYPDSDIPGARAFDFFATTRAGGHQVFCQAVVFSVAADVFVLDDCYPAPRSADRVLAAARVQYERATLALGVPLATSPP